MENITLKQFLDKQKIINKAQLAKLMYPNSTKHFKTKFSNKLNGVIAGTGVQRITDADLAAAKNVLNQLAKDILDFNNNATLD